MVRVDLSDADANAFRTFQQYRDFFNALIEAKLPEHCSTTAIINLDADGRVQQVRIEEVAYRHKKAVAN